MTRFEIRMARDALVQLAELDMSDDSAMARMLGRLEVVLEGLLRVVDEEGEQ